MYKYALRLLAFASFVGWCITARRAHHYGPDEKDDERRNNDDEDDGALFV